MEGINFWQALKVKFHLHPPVRALKQSLTMYMLNVIWKVNCVRCYDHTATAVGKGNHICHAEVDTTLSLTISINPMNEFFIIFKCSQVKCFITRNSSIMFRKQIENIPCCIWMLPNLRLVSPDIHITVGESTTFSSFSHTTFNRYMRNINES